MTANAALDRLRRSLEAGVIPAPTVKVQLEDIRRQLAELRTDMIELMVIANEARNLARLLWNERARDVVRLGKGEGGEDADR